MVNIYMKRDTVLLIIREMKIKEPMRHHLTIFRISIYKRVQETILCKDVGKKPTKTLVHCLW